MLIVGAGPAGSTAAILLARMGARVTIVDKSRFPREKLCGEFVSPEAIRILGRTGALASLERVAGRGAAVVLTDARGRSARLRIPGPGPEAGEALGIPRRDMDAALLDEAARAGVEVIEGFEVKLPLLARGRTLGVAGLERGASRERRLEAPFVIAADGRDSAMARGLAPEAFRSRASPMFGVQAHFRGIRGFGGAVELHYFRGGYVGLHEVGTGLVNVCALIDRSVAGEIPKQPERILRELFFTNAAARARLEGAERVSDWLAVGSLVFRAEAPVRAGALFLGDAAGTIDPFAGEGMSMAFRSAEIAAERIAAALTHGEDAAVSPAYAAGWRREFAFRIRICRAIGRLTVRTALQGPMIGILRALPFLGNVLIRGTRAGVALRPRDDGPA